MMRYLALALAPLLAAPALAQPPRTDWSKPVTSDAPPQPDGAAPRTTDIRVPVTGVFIPRTAPGPDAKECREKMTPGPDGQRTYQWICEPPAPTAKPAATSAVPALPQ